MGEIRCCECGAFIKIQENQSSVFCGKCGTKQSLVQTEEQQGFYNKKIMVVSGSNVTNGDSMIKRGYMSLEDHDWNSANDFFEAALNLNAEDGEAYLGKFLVKQKSQSIQELFAKLEQNTELVSDKEKRFFIGQDEEEFASHIEEQIKEKMIPNYLEETRIRCLYKYVQSYESNWKGRLHQKETALTLFEDRDYKRAIKYLPDEQLKLLNKAFDDYMQLLDDRIADAKEEDDRFVETEKQKYADFIRTQDEILEDEYQRAFEERADEYQRGVDLLDDARTIEDFWNLFSIFERMEGYKDSADLLKNCRETLAELEEQRRLEQEQERIRLEEERVAKQKATRRKRIINVTMVLVLLFFVIFWIYVNKTDEALAQYRNAKKGDIVTFGNYHGSREWIVLEKEGNQLMLLSKEGIDMGAYHEWDEATTWEDCTLREWLNSDYISDAFSWRERNMIQSTCVINQDDSKSGTAGGNDTYDNVFLLSFEEAEQYFFKARICIPSAYANERYVELKGSGYDAGESCWWWLRSPGYGSYDAAYVTSGGSVYYSGTYVSTRCGAVRPALWINLDS